MKFVQVFLYYPTRKTQNNCLANPIGTTGCFTEKFFQSFFLNLSYLIEHRKYEKINFIFASFFILSVRLTIFSCSKPLIFCCEFGYLLCILTCIATNSTYFPLISFSFNRYWTSIIFLNIYIEQNPNFTPN